MRGDSNGDGIIDISDSISSLFYLFAFHELDCQDAADVDDNGAIEITDLTRLLGYLFLDQPPPPEPFPECGWDWGEDELACKSNFVCLENSILSVGAFNIEVFNPNKAGNGEIMAVLARITREFDLLVAQEIRDSSEGVADTFLNKINLLPGSKYQMYESPRIGGEQYAFYYDADRVEFIDAQVYPDPNEILVRGLIIARFRVHLFEFTLLAIHANHVQTSSELEEIARAVDSQLVSNPAENDLIILGDLNADCDSFDENDFQHPLRQAKYHWVITNEMDTLVDPTADCTRDRIILLNNTFTQEYVPGSAGVFYFDRQYGLDSSFSRSVSDHYPVFARFKVNLQIDDGWR